MASLDRPKLRPLYGRRVDHEGRPFVSLEDSLKLIHGPVLIPFETFSTLLRHFDGRCSLVEHVERVRRETGEIIQPSDLLALVEKLDRAMVLDGPSFAAFSSEYASQTVRPSWLAGWSYPADPVALRIDLDRYYADQNGAGEAAGHADSSSPTIRAILSPHIDFGRGGPTYTHAYRSLVDGSNADVFVILGVAHQYCQHRFALTRKDFETPLGTVRTEQTFVDRIAEVAGPHLFEDELAHRTEHSIEHQVIFLQHALAGRRDFTIVPILVGSFHDLMVAGSEPASDPEIAAMIRAIQSAETASGKTVAYVGGIDLSHVGPEFGDPAPVDDPTLSRIEQFDRTMLDQATSGDASGWFKTAAEVENRWRVCGLAATYTMLRAIGPANGKILRYDQAVNPARSCCVTFASVAFEATSVASDE